MSVHKFHTTANSPVSPPRIMSPEYSYGILQTPTFSKGSASLLKLISRVLRGSPPDRYFRPMSALRSLSKVTQNELAALTTVRRGLSLPLHLCCLILAEKIHLAHPGICLLLKFSRLGPLLCRGEYCVVPCRHDKVEKGMPHMLHGL